MELNRDRLEIQLAAGIQQDEHRVILWQPVHRSWHQLKHLAFFFGLVG